MNEATGELEPEEFPPEPNDDQEESYGDEENDPQQDQHHPESIQELVLHHDRLIRQLGNAVETGQVETDSSFQQIRGGLETIQNTLKALTEKPPADKADEWNWRPLAGESAAALLDKVREWVDWYNGRYGVLEMYRIPGCWYLHPPVVEELTALWVAWRAAYHGHKAPDTAATYWHSAYLWPTITRVRNEAWGMKACSTGHQLYREVTSASTDKGYALVRSALTETSIAPVIPWPGQRPTPPQHHEQPQTAPIPVVAVSAVPSTSL